MKKNKIEIVSIILARSGSKGLKNKNLFMLDGKPLIYYAIEAAKSSKKIKRVLFQLIVRNCNGIKKIWSRSTFLEEEKICWRFFNNRGNAS